MNVSDFNALAQQYKSELLKDVRPFWLERFQDKQIGGYFTRLTRFAI